VKNFHAYLRKCSWNDVPCAARAGRVPYRVIQPDGSHTGLFTGYFEPLLRGSYSHAPPFVHPVYAPPPDLVQLPNVENSQQPGAFAYGKMQNGKCVPHVRRGDVMAGALAHQNLEILYVDDAVDLFFAHVQGSAAVQLPDGSIQRISFAGKSGHPYTAIGKTLKEMGVLQPPITMEAIKTWLRANPSHQDEIFASNASYIFFTFSDSAGPVGASREVLIPQQSLAVDDTIWPYGLEVIIATTDPCDAHKPLTLTMRTADTGSAIRGVIRGDIYFGSGELAAAQAGAMNAQGRMWVLLPH
jgi:membrane-bound lytic murein transglycosylase A